MTREVYLPRINWDDIVGVRAVFPVAVDWPELQLTKDQILANAIARLDGEELPFPENYIFNVVIER